MMIPSSIRSAAVAVLAVAAVGAASAAQADSGTIRFSVYKAAFFVGGSGGEGTLTFHGRTYPIAIGGISGGLAFGASKTNFQGTVRNIKRASDVSGIYAAVGGGGNRIMGKRIVENARLAFGPAPARWPTPTRSSATTTSRPATTCSRARSSSAANMPRPRRST